MNLILSIQFIISILLMAAILMQVKGQGFGKAWGSSSSFSRRGLERLVFRGTFVLAAIFILVSILQLLVK